MVKNSGTQSYIVIASNLSFFTLVINSITIKDHMLLICSLLVFITSFTIHGYYAFEKALDDYIKNSSKKEIIKSFVIIISILSTSLCMFSVSKFAINFL